MTKKNKQESPLKSQDDLLQETRDNIARERTMKFLQKWGARFTFLAIIGSVAGFAYISWKKHEKEAVAEKFNIYYSSLDKIHNKEKESFPKIKEDLTKLEDNQGFKVLSDLAQAKMDLITDKKSQAIEKYSNIGNKLDLNNYNNYGFIVSGFNQLDLPEGLNNNTLSNLDKIIEKKSNFSTLAMEIKALNILKTGDKELAKKEFEQIITSPQVLPRQKARINQILSAI